jgi:hypothetical protein
MPPKGKTAEYDRVDECMAVLGPLMVGITRREQVTHLLPEMLLARALGIPKWPTGDTERRFLVAANEQTLRAADEVLQENILQEVLAHEPVTVRVHGDLSGLSSRARKREGVRPGYMGGPIKPGYRPMRIEVEGLPVQVELRPGNDACTDLPDRILERARKVRQRLPRSEIRVGIDSASGKAHVIAQLQKHQHERPGDRKLQFYIGGASQHARGWWSQAVSPLSKIKPGWKRVSVTTEIRELGWQRPWGERKASARVVAVRRKEWSRSKRKKRTHRVQVIYTGSSPQAESARGVFVEYHERQRVENGIKNAKQSFPVRGLPVREPIGNRINVRMVALGEQVVILYKRTFEEYAGADRWGPMAKTIRRSLFEAPEKKTGRHDDPVGTALCGVPNDRADRQAAGGPDGDPASDRAANGSGTVIPKLRDVR